MASLVGSLGFGHHSLIKIKTSVAPQLALFTVL